MPSDEANETTFEVLLRGSSGSGEDEGNGEGATLGAVVGAVVGAGPLDAGALVDPWVGAVVGFVVPFEEPHAARVRPTRIPIAIRPRVVARMARYTAPAARKDRPS
jgi:hypothetical protein